MVLLLEVSPFERHPLDMSSEPKMFQREDISKLSNGGRLYHSRCKSCIAKRISRKTHYH
jgi:hypothetical protein